MSYPSVTFHQFCPYSQQMKFLFMVFSAFCHICTGLTGGLAAPLVAAGAGAIIGGAGAAALGSVAGVAIIGSLFGVAGAGLTG